jgi:nitrite reductase/ring-hydroxylating ferredoxin subunit
VSSGAVRAGPAEKGIETFRVERKGDRIEISLKS